MIDGPECKTLRAGRAGMAAYERGLPVHANPYPEDSFLYSCWQCGWIDAPRRGAKSQKLVTKWSHPYQKRYKKGLTTNRRKSLF